MTISSRTDKSRNNKQGIEAKRMEATRIHTDALRASDYLKVVSLKNEGEKCKTCLYCIGIFFHSSCTLKKKLINPLAICPNWKRKS